MSNEIVDMGYSGNYNYAFLNNINTLDGNNNNNHHHSNNNSFNNSNNNNNNNSSSNLRASNISNNDCGVRPASAGGSIQFQLHSQEKILLKHIANLPYLQRENILSVFNFLSSSIVTYENKMEAACNEAHHLRTTTKQVLSERDISNKVLENYKEKLKIMQDSVETMRDHVDTQRNFSVRNKRVVERLSATNRMLIDSLEALHVQQPQRTQTASKLPRPGLLRPMSYNEINASSPQQDLEVVDLNVSNNIVEVKDEDNKNVEKVVKKWIRCGKRLKN